MEERKYETMTNGQMLDYVARFDKLALDLAPDTNDNQWCGEWQPR